MLDQSTVQTDGEPETNETEPTPEQADGETGVSAPGFGVAVAVVSLLGGSLLARRRSGA